MYYEYDKHPDDDTSKVVSDKRMTIVLGHVSVRFCRIQLYIKCQTYGISINTLI